MACPLSGAPLQSSVRIGRLDNGVLFLVPRFLPKTSAQSRHYKTAWVARPGPCDSQHLLLVWRCALVFLVGTLVGRGCRILRRRRLVGLVLEELLRRRDRLVDQRDLLLGLLDVIGAAALLDELLEVALRLLVGADRLLRILLDRAE